MEVKQPFQPGNRVRCRDIGVRTALTVGSDYEIRACAILGPLWMVQVCGPHGFDLMTGKPIWYQARRFIGKGSQSHATA